MHPDPAFALDAAACRIVAAQVAFAQVFVHAPDGIALIHVPCVLDGPDRLSFHLSRRNRALPLLEGAGAIAGFVAAEGYVSPDWYDGDGQVPTWNYLAVEAEGSVSALSHAALVTQVDRLGATHEERLAPKPAWTRDKMPPGRFDAMTAGIAGFALDVATWRGTAKLSQNKPIADVAGTIRGLRDAGNITLAAHVDGANRQRP